MKAKTALSRSGLPGLDYALNPYFGCSHGCVYCYAADILRLDGKKKWGEFSELKEGLPKILASELKRKNKGMIGLGTVTDPYQPSEAKTMTVRYCLEQIARRGWPVCIQTKSYLVTRDIDIISKIKGAEVGITITTLDEKLAGKLEPGAAGPEKRLAALRELGHAGIKTWVFIGPIIPGMNDSGKMLADVVREAKNAGAGYVMYDRLRLKPRLSRRMEEKPETEMARIRKLANDDAWFDRVSKTMDIVCLDAGIECRKAF